MMERQELRRVSLITRRVVDATPRALYPRTRNTALSVWSPTELQPLSVVLAHQLVLVAETHTWESSRNEHHILKIQSLSGLCAH